MYKLSSPQIKQELFSILRVFADYCDTHNLRYYLCGGTLLGAVRHEDFIPWDDDIDLLMPRPDYVRLHELMITEPMGKGLELVSWQQGNSRIPFAKIIQNNVHVKTSFNKVDEYLWIDIFPMDGVPEDQKCSDQLLAKAQKYKHLYGFASANFGSGTTVFKKAAKLPALCLARLYGTRRCAKKLDSLAQKYDFETSEYVAGIAWSCGPNERMKKAEFLPIVELPFHGRTFHAPACWDFYLKAMYGEYMKLPPESKRYSHYFQAYRIEGTE